MTQGVAAQRGALRNSQSRWVGGDDMNCRDRTSVMRSWRLMSSRRIAGPCRPDAQFSLRSRLGRSLMLAIVVSAGKEKYK